MRKRTIMKSMLCTVFCITVLLFSGCSLLNEEKMKLRDLEFVVLSEERIPEELKKILEEKKTAPFQITYSDQKNLYICTGYGEQKTGGYSIVVDELYLTESQIIVNTCLLGPEGTSKEPMVPSYPYIVLRTELLDKPVLFK